MKSMSYRWRGDQCMLQAVDGATHPMVLPTRVEVQASLTEQFAQERCAGTLSLTEGEQAMQRFVNGKLVTATITVAGGQVQHIAVQSFINISDWVSRWGRGSGMWMSGRARDAIVPEIAADWVSWQGQAEAGDTFCQYLSAKTGTVLQVGVNDFLVAAVQAVDGTHGVVFHNAQAQSVQFVRLTDDPATAANV